MNRLIKLLKKEPVTINEFEELKAKIWVAFMNNFEEDEGIGLIIQDNINKTNNKQELNKYLYYTLKELYLIDIKDPIEFLTTGKCETRQISLNEWIKQ